MQQILWLAIFLYSVGLGVVFHFKPSLMWNDNGSWKEFGYQRNKSRYTLFPVWLFAIVWALVSYTLSAVIISITSSASPSEIGMATVAAVAASNFEESPAEEFYPTPISQIISEKRPRGRPRKTVTMDVASQPTRAGYYVLDPSSRDAGLHRYVYYGPTPPTDADEVIYNGDE